MTEEQKMLRGKPYYGFDLDLLEKRQKAKMLLFEFNQLMPTEITKRNELLKKLLGKTGEEFFVEPPFRCDYGCNTEIGNNFYANFNCTILDCAKVTIGDNVMLAPNVGIFTAGHPIHHELRNSGVEYAFPITIGNNVWIGGNTVINPGVTIGDNTVIGSGSVVTKDIPSNVIAAGIPCKVIREITDEDKLYYYKNLRLDESLEEL